MKALLTAGAAAIGLALAAIAPATAGPDFQEMRTQLLLQKLLSGDTGTAKTAKAAVTRTAKIRVKGTIHRKGSFSLPMWCHVFVHYFDGNDSFFESKSEQAEFSAGKGTCNVVIPFRWKVADDSNQVEAGVEVSNHQLDGRALAKAAPQVGRASEVNLPALPFPAEGSVTTRTFNIDM